MRAAKRKGVVAYGASGDSLFQGTDDAVVVRLLKTEIEDVYPPPLIISPSIKVNVLDISKKLSLPLTVDGHLGDTRDLHLRAGSTDRNSERATFSIGIAVRCLSGCRSQTRNDRGLEQVQLYSLFSPNKDCAPLPSFLPHAPEFDTTI